MGNRLPRKPSGLRRCFDRLRFGLERLLLRGLRYRLLLAAVIVAVVAVVAGTAAAVLGSGLGLGEAIWWAFLRLTDPGYLGDDEGVVLRTISTVVTVLGYLLFLGLLIAILTQWLNETIRKLESGITPVALRGHVIVLGWTHRTPAIVEELLRTGPRSQRFLARHDARELRVVILAEHVDSDLARLLRERLGALWNDRRVLLRAGSPVRLDDLERVAFRDAAVLILPGADFAERHPLAVDAQAVKTLMSVSRNASGAGSEPPLAVAAFYDGNKAGVARRAYGADCEIVAADDFVSSVIAQSVRQAGVWSVFEELLTLDTGNSLYIRRPEGLAGSRYDEARGAFEKAIPLGMIRSGGGRPDLNPDPQTVLGADDRLVFVARSYDDCAPGATRLARAATAAAPPLRAGGERRRRVLILGWSRKLPALLHEFGRYGGAFEMDLVSATPIADRDRALASHSADVPTEGVRHVEAAYTVPGVLERLAPRNYDNIILMASERYGDGATADSTTVLTYQTLRGLLPEQGPRPELVVELLDDENRFLFPEQEDVIVSPMLVSYLLSQVTLRRELAAVFGELTQPWGAQIVLHPAQGYLSATAPVRFGDLEAAAAARGEIALGLRRAGGTGAGLALNPDRDAAWTLSPDDHVVVLAFYAELEGGK